MPNILMNLSHGGAPPLVSGDDSGSFSVRIRPAAFAETGSRLFAGDWGTLPEVVQQVAAVSWGDHQYDLILTSETIYSTASYDKLIGAMSSLLRRPSGVAYVLPSPPPPSHGSCGSLFPFSPAPLHKDWCQPRRIISELVEGRTRSPKNCWRQGSLLSPRCSLCMAEFTGRFFKLHGNNRHQRQNTADTTDPH